MSDDIVVRLRHEAEEWWECCNNIHLPLIEAADEIERLRKLGDRLSSKCRRYSANVEVQEAMRAWKEARRG